MNTFEEATESIRSLFARRRISTFAKKNSVTNEDVEVVDDIPIDELVSSFKRSVNPPIRIRLFKNLNEEQQKAWITYYDDHKQLSLQVKSNNSSTVHKESKTKKALELLPTPEPKKSDKTDKRVKTDKLEKQDTNDKTNKRVKSRPSLVEQSDSDSLELLPPKPKHHKSKSEKLTESMSIKPPKIRSNRVMTDNEIVEQIIKSSSEPEPEVKHRKHRVKKTDK